MPPEIAPHWYETPLWFLLQVIVFAALWAASRAILPGSASRAPIGLGLLVIVFLGSVQVRAWLRRRDA